VEIPPAECPIFAGRKKPFGVLGPVQGVHRTDVSSKRKKFMSRFGVPKIETAESIPTGDEQAIWTERNRENPIGMLT
jgi:hypothetical protein